MEVACGWLVKAWNGKVDGHNDRQVISVQRMDAWGGVTRCDEVSSGVGNPHIVRAGPFVSTGLICWYAGRER